MITDDDLHSLADSPATGHVAPRPVADVLVRGGRLRRRRQAIRAVGVTAVVGSVAATGSLVLARGDGSPGDVQTAQETPETTGTPTEEPPTLSADPFSCLPSDPDEGVEIVMPEQIPPEEVRDAARVLPTWTPGDIPVTSAHGLRDDLSGGGCATPTATMQETLVLKATSGDGSVSGSIELEGPYSMLAAPETHSVGATPTQVRGQDGHVVDPSFGDDTILEWTEPDGSGWRLWGVRADEATLRAVAEALELDSSPASGVPPASIAPEDLPAGYEVETQATTVPPPYEAGDDSQTRWTVMVGTPMATQTGIICHLTATDSGEGEPTELPAGVGSQPVTVGGKPGVWAPLMGAGDFEGADRWRSLSWEVAPGVVAAADCSNWGSDGGRTLPVEDVIRFAESVEPVAADDPRIPEPPAEPTG